MTRLRCKAFTASSMRKVPPRTGSFRHRDNRDNSDRAAHRFRTRLGVVAVSFVAICLDVDGRAILNLEGLGHSRYTRMANADHWCLP